MGISLLSDSISTPDGWQGSEYSHWVRPFTLSHLSYEVDVATLVAFLGSFALLGVCLGEAERVEGQRVSETLHHRVKETCIAVIVHGECHMRWQLTFSTICRFHFRGGRAFRSAVFHKGVSSRRVHGLE